MAGRPHSYFRREDLLDWADAWGVPRPGGIDDAAFDRAFLDAMQREGTAGTGVFGLRLMWGSVDEAAERLNRAAATDRDIAQSLRERFGPTLFVHLWREDKVAQAVSLTRAEQSGLWHLSADGTVLEGAAAARPASYDEARIAQAVEDLRRDDRSWKAFFDARGIVPLKLTCETLTADPHAALGRVLAALGLDPEAARSVEVPTARTADGDSARWIARFRRRSGG